MMTKYTIHWFHIPSATFGTSEHDSISIQELYRKINDWNRSNPGMWQYWFLPGISGNGSDTKDAYRKTPEPEHGYI